MRIEKIKKTVEIKGMHCPACAARVEKALNAIDGVSAKVDLKKALALLTLRGEVSDETIRAAISSLGFETGEIR